MAKSDTLFLICQAAVLPDDAAHDLISTYLNARLALLTEDDYLGEMLLFALAWFDPEAALNCYDTLSSEVRQGIDRSWLEAYREAQQLQGRSSEEMAVYNTMTALLPQDSPEAEKRHRARWLYFARWSHDEFFALHHWSRDLHGNIFVFARLWLAAPELLRERLIALRNSALWSGLYYSLSQMLLVAQGQPSNIPRLMELTHEFLSMKHQGRLGLEMHALGYSLGFLRAHAPEQAIELIPELVVLLGLGKEREGAALTAHILVLLTDFRLDTAELLVPLRERVEQDPKQDMVRRWLRGIQHRLPNLTTEPASSQEWVRILRLFLLLRRLKETLLHRKRRATPARIRRSWHWLLYSERLITLVTDDYWRGQLLEKRAVLEAQVRESRRPVHIAATSLEAQ
ncbi:MAG: hypothetical protein QM758_03865 [Armatimonas sp.]